MGNYGSTRRWKEEFLKECLEHQEMMTDKMPITIASDSSSEAYLQKKICFLPNMGTKKVRSLESRGAS
jgi:hypothetical protein